MIVMLEGVASDRVEAYAEKLSNALGLPWFRPPGFNSEKVPKIHEMAKALGKGSILAPGLYSALGCDLHFFGTEPDPSKWAGYLKRWKAVVVFLRASREAVKNSGEASYCKTKKDFLRAQDAIEKHFQRSQLRKATVNTDIAEVDDGVKRIVNLLKG